MKKIFLVIFLILVAAVGVASQEIQKNNDEVKFYYISARNYKKPSKKVRTEAGKALVEAINNAKQTIDFAFYGLSGQDEILNALLNAQKRGVVIRGIVDKNVENKNDYSGTEYSIQKLGENVVKTDYKAEIEKLNKIKNKEIDFKN